ncbi:hypothetical protein [Methanobrevibacter sp.]
MRRRNDDKRVLVPRNNQKNPRRQKRKSHKGKHNGRFLFIVILALVAFVIGAGIGISFTFDDGSDGPHWKNVTKEMTTNVSQEPVYFDIEEDRVDFNDNETLEKLNITSEPSY